MNDQAITKDPVVLVHLRNEFYRKKFRLMLGVYVLSLLANVVLIGMIIFLVEHPTQPLYFPTDKVGRLISVMPLQESNMSLQDVSAWAVEAVQAAYSYDFVHYHAQLQNAEKYFSEYGWSDYMSALRQSNNFIALTDRKLVVVAKVVAPPKLLNQGILNGAYAWKFEMPVLVTYSMPPFDDKSRFSNPLIITVIVQRQNALQSYKGLAIVQSIAKIAVVPS